LILLLSLNCLSYDTEDIWTESAQSFSAMHGFYKQYLRLLPRRHRRGLTHRRPFQNLPRSQAQPGRHRNGQILYRSRSPQRQLHGLQLNHLWFLGQIPPGIIGIPGKEPGKPRPEKSCI